LSFRAIVVVGDKKGRVGVRIGKAKEVVDAIAKSATNVRRNIIAVPMTKYSTFPHRYDELLVLKFVLFFFTMCILMFWGLL